MSRFTRSLFVVPLVAAATSLATQVAPSLAAPSSVAVAHRSEKAVCAAADAGEARCHAHVVTDGSAHPAVTSSYVSGYRPSDLQGAYNLGAAISTQTTHPTVAIVDAYDDPYAERDLATYRSTWGLSACTTANGCFKKVNQSGKTNGLPRADVNWAGEISLDLDMVSATCPGCKILLVEARSASFNDLATAVDYAASVPGVVAISNSYGGSEWSTETSFESHYNHPGKAITVSSGDDGYGVQFPAASRYVTAVGGTALTQDATSGRGWTETVWGDTARAWGAGSGCSAFVGKPTWQHDTGCSRRTVADVAAVADPMTGVAVYDTYTSSPGWYVYGGTSAAAPIVASVYALAGNATTVVAGSFPYGATSGLNDVTSGSNWVSTTTPATCGYLCTGGSGYDGPTGLGTPNGVTAF